MKQVNDSFISFYLKANKIHLFVSALRDLDCPSRICFLLDNSGKVLVMIPHAKRDLISHAIPRDTYRGMMYMEVCSKKLCQLLASRHGWDPNYSYRIPGVVYLDQRVAKYDLTQAEIIKRSKPVH